MRIIVNFTNQNVQRTFNGKRFPANLKVAVDVNPRKGIQSAVMTAARLAKKRFGKVRLVNGPAVVVPTSA